MKDTHDKVIGMIRRGWLPNNKLLDELREKRNQGISLLP